MFPPINVTKPTLPPFEEYAALIKTIWENHWLTNSGPLHEQLATDLKQYLNIESISLYNNGHNALEAAIHAFNLPKNSEVITTPYTFASTTHAIVRNGLTPVFCDISYNDYNIDVAKIEGLITDKTSAIVPVHVYGTPCDVHAIERIAKKYDLKVVYDAAHAFGVKINDRSITSWGDASMLSFHATKVFNTVEGGAIISSDKSITDAADRYKNFGMEGQNDFIEAGTNAKMSEFHAAMGLANMKYIDENISKRRLLVNKYDELLSDIEGIKLLSHAKDIESNYAYYPVVFEETCLHSRDQMYELLKSHGIYARKYFYPIATNLQCYQKTEINTSTPIAQSVSENVLCLPLYDMLNGDSINYIVNIISENRN